MKTSTSHMKKKLITLACLTLLASGGYGGFRIGLLFQRHQDEVEAVSVDAAHYDQKSAGFRWGSVDSVNMAKLDLGEIMEAKPIRKPMHP